MAGKDKHTGDLFGLTQGGGRQYFGLRNPLAGFKRPEAVLRANRELNGPRILMSESGRLGQRVGSDTHKTYLKNVLNFFQKCFCRNSQAATKA